MVEIHQIGLGQKVLDCVVYIYIEPIKVSMHAYACTCVGSMYMDLYMNSAQ